MSEKAKETAKKAKEKSKGFIKEFKEFALKGNVMDMAVGVIIGAAFGNIVTALTTDFINPLINSIGGAEIAGQIKLPWVEYERLTSEEATALSLTALPGVVVQCDSRNGLIIGCGDGALQIDSLQLPGKKMMSGRDFCNGRDLHGVVLK